MSTEPTIRPAAPRVSPDTAADDLIPSDRPDEAQDADVGEHVDFVVASLRAEVERLDAEITEVEGRRPRRGFSAQQKAKALDALRTERDVKLRRLMDALDGLLRRARGAQPGNSNARRRPDAEPIRDLRLVFDGPAGVSDHDQGFMAFERTRPRPDEHHDGIEWVFQPGSKREESNRWTPIQVEQTDEYRVVIPALPRTEYPRPVEPQEEAEPDVSPQVAAPEPVEELPIPVDATDPVYVRSVVRRMAAEEAEARRKAMEEREARRRQQEIRQRVPDPIWVALLDRDGNQITDDRGQIKAQKYPAGFFSRAEVQALKDAGRLVLGPQVIDLEEPLEADEVLDAWESADLLSEADDRDLGWGIGSGDQGYSGFGEIFDP